MFRLQLVLCLCMGFQLNAVNNILNAFPICEEIETDIDQSKEIESLGEIELDLSYLHKSYYGVPDESMEKRLSEAQRKTKELGRDFNPEEFGTYLEGDLLLPIDESKLTLQLDVHDRKATLWPNGVVPYRIDYQFSRKERDTIHNAIKEYHANTCIRFRKHTIEKDYVYFVGRGEGCHSQIGRTGGRQIINLHRPYCLQQFGTVLHEMMHALGFLHEQSRNDRDIYVNIIWDNILEGYKNDFAKSNNKNYSAGFVYDYSSVMHYNAFSFAKDSRSYTIETWDPSKQKVIGQRSGFSPDDLIKINTRYQCKLLDAIHNEDDDVGLFFQFQSGNFTIDIDYNADDIDY